MIETRDPYAPPRAELLPGEARRGSALNALAFGFLIAFAAPNVGTAVLRLATLLGAVQMRFDHVHLALAQRLSSQLLAGVAALAGGYACALIAARRELALGAVLGAHTPAVGYAPSLGDADALSDRGFMAATFALVLLGSWMGRRQNRAG
jgi:hypothetical protein